MHNFWIFKLMKIDFSNKTIIVTGGTRGIGNAIANLFNRLNGNVIATGTDKKEIKNLNESSTSGEIKYFHLDYNMKQSVELFLKYLSEHKYIDVLINNAGINKINSIDVIKENEWDTINNVNLRGPFLLTKKMAYIMKNQKFGKIVNIASIFSVVSKAKRAVYSTTKWGMVGFTKAVALDLAPYNILVNSVSPGFVDTELTKEVLGEQGIKKVVKSIPQNRLATPEEVAKIVVFLSSDNNSYLTGQNIIVDGGFTVV